MTELKGFQRRALRGLAHGLEPCVHVGREGLSASVLASLDEALLSHELIKVRFVGHKEERRELAAEMAERCKAELAGVVGHVAILFRPHPEPEKRRVVVPVRAED